MSPVSTPLPLLPHPASPAIDLRISALATLEARELVLHYRVSGDTAAVRWPEAAGGGAADGLWRHTCFEAFLSGDSPSAYREFNFSPSGRWADYSFQRARERDPRAQAPHAPLIERREHPEGVELVAVLDRRHLPAGPWRLGLTAVIEDRQGRVSHWALHHPRATPDFHDPAGWTLQLPSR